MTQQFMDSGVQKSSRWHCHFTGRCPRCGIIVLPPPCQDCVGRLPDHRACDPAGQVMADPGEEERATPQLQLAEETVTGRQRATDTLVHGAMRTVCSPPGPHVAALGANFCPSCTAGQQSVPAARPWGSTHGPMHWMSHMGAGRILECANGAVPAGHVLGRTAA